ncbi:MAG: glycosyl hydrolase [Bacteroidetes bacterium]|nr:MAG: glycosyl hydrolase [Bacteroidota bacterium]
MPKYKSFILFYIAVFLLSTSAFSQEVDSVAVDRLAQDSLVQDSLIVIPKVLTQEEWVDSVFNSLSDDEKIGQLFMIRAHSNKNKAYHEKIADEIRNNKVGGVCFFQGGPVRQIDLVNYYQEISKTPLFVAIDGEWGISMRLDSVEKFPRQMTLGAIQNDSLIYQMGKQIADQCKLVGVNINFAPVVDVNNNPQNPVINSRSFGENQNKVAQKGTMYMLGLQDDSVMAVAKHFPGHGDTDSDSHKTLPTVNASKHDIDSIHLTPFKALINHNVGGIMIAHLFIPAIDTTQGRASSLSPIMVQAMLKDSLHFKGLAITDALEMKGVSNYNEPGQLEVKALLAGNDILLMPKDVRTSIDAIKKAISDSILSQETIDNRVRKILIEKYKLGLSQRKPLDKTNIYNRINTTHNKALIKELYRNAITLIKNNDKLLPLTTSPKAKMAVVSIGFPKDNPFSKRFNDYRKADRFHLDSRSTMSNVNAMVEKLKGYDVVIVDINKTSNSARKNYAIYQSSIDFCNLIAQKTKLIVVIQGSPYSLKRFTEGSNAQAIIVAYQDSDAALEAAAESLFGGFDISGSLPVSSSKNYPAGFGIQLKKKRISFGFPEEVGINSDSLGLIDSIIQFGIDTGAYPGCQVLIAKDGMIIYNRAFGSKTYAKKDSIDLDNIYDLASVTKVLATTLAVMRLANEGKIDVDRRLKYYLPELDSTNKGDLLIRDVMSHQARLTPWIPFYNHTIKDGKLNTYLYSKEKKPGYEIQVADHMYILNSYQDTIWNEIINSKLLRRKKYRYSDLGFYIMKEIVERQTHTSIDHYMDSVFYKPMGLQSIGYLPLTKFDSSLIVPTEKDNYFRNQLIYGYVHDQGCAMMGGVEGHAGLFGNSLDVAILAQMLLQEGVYGDINYLDTNEIEDFTRQQFPLNDNRRGLGFDKPLPNPEDGGPTCELVSSQSFGHSGFTGTYFWVDPKYKLTYVFLSNRVYPDAENKLLIKLDIRTRIQEKIYHAMGVNHRE